jgi:glycosyltransferase involved in cell wall biosynthesis
VSAALRVSICLVTYNRSAELCKTLDSLLVQTFSDFELIICDDCSPDNTQQICLKYEKRDSRIRYRRNRRNLGMPGNLNSSILASSGEYIANLHDGDIYDPTLLEKWSRSLDAYPQAAFVFNAYRDLDTDGKERVIYREPLPKCVPGHVLLEDIFFKRWRFDSPVFGTVMARRSAYEEIGLFNKRFGFFSDVDMWMRLAERYSVAYINEPLISLPSKKIVPRQFTLSFWEEQRTVERIFWDARLRHYRERSLRLLVEIVRHGCFVMASRTWKLALMVRRRLLNSVRKRICLEK